MHGHRSMLWRFVPRLADRQRTRIYDEIAFRRLLAVERERSRRSGRPFLLVLVEWDAPDGLEVRWNPQVARQVFRVLAGCLRETDFIGWYVGRRAAGAVLTELGDAPRADVAERVAGRLGDRLRAAIHPSMIDRLRVRFFFDLEPSSGGLACSS